MQRNGENLFWQSEPFPSYPNRQRGQLQKVVVRLTVRSTKIHRSGLSSVEHDRSTSPIFFRTEINSCFVNKQDARTVSAKHSQDKAQGFFEMSRPVVTLVFPRSRWPYVARATGLFKHIHTEYTQRWQEYHEHTRATLWLPRPLQLNVLP